ncbi:MAG: shikimate dehydrogenase [Bacteroidia bacterium]
MLTYGLLGYPLTHSFSKQYFTEKFEKEQIKNCEYRLFPLEHISQFPILLAKYTNLKGLNVTIPYKQVVLPLLDELDPTAKAVGAVNCIKIIAGKGNQLATLIGYNTDVYGFKMSIKPFLEQHHERALILGTGGASKAVAYVLNEIGIDCYFVTRNKEKNNLQTNTTKVFTYDELNEYILNAFQLIVNTTPLGTYPNVNTCPAIPFEFVKNTHLLYDLVYNPTETEFLKRGKAQGATTINGLSMLHLQADEAWRIWNS